MLPRPQRPLLFSTVLLCLLISPLALSQIYSWVDENGKKHFGDKIPPQYQDQGSEHQLSDINTSEAVQVEPAKRSSQNSQSMPWAEIDTEAIQRSHNSLPSMPTAQPSGCAGQKAAYKQSSDCFAICRRGSSNVASCGHCKQMKKPQC
jgi:hypothetical protein